MRPPDSTPSPYISIKSANEDAGHFFLFTVTNAAHMLCKESFCAGGPRHLCRLSAQESGGDHGPGGGRTPGPAERGGE